MQFWRRFLNIYFIFEPNTPAAVPFWTLRLPLEQSGRSPLDNTSFQISDKLHQSPLDKAFYQISKA